MKRCYIVNMFRARWQGRGLYFQGCAGQIQGRDASSSSSSSRSHCSHTGRRHWWCCASEKKLALHPGEFTWNLRKTALGHYGVSIATILHLVGRPVRRWPSQWVNGATPAKHPKLCSFLAIHIQRVRCLPIAHLNIVCKIRLCFSFKTYIVLSLHLAGV